MPRKRTELNIAAGKLISVIQKEWVKESGEPAAKLSEEIMDSAYDFLQADSIEEVKMLLGPDTISQYLGDEWVKNHPDVLPAIMRIEKVLASQ